MFTKKTMQGVTLNRPNNWHVQRESSLYVLKTAIHSDRLRYIFYDLCRGLFFSCLSCLCILDHAWDVKTQFPFGRRLIILQAGGDNSVLIDSYRWTTYSTDRLLMSSDEETQRCLGTNSFLLLLFLYQCFPVNQLDHCGKSYEKQTS